MECLECEAKTGVLDTINYAGVVYRKRKCKKCAFTFWTEELEVADPRDVTDALAFKKQSYRDRKKRRGYKL